MEPLLMLLNHTQMPLGRYKKNLIRHFLNAAKSLIPARWKSSDIPTISQWMDKVDELFAMKSLTAEHKNAAPVCGHM
ncbi:Hypothetical predicted protein [Pelobates cultripes]|uniref:Uncharacterized protein n=1 Tax=Pelobates cultripes TaxID=61616 RepID=A0AAD1SB53_PELCU|nr:Hypothetical predicted protein [Pelobates cultripes]